MKPYFEDEQHWGELLEELEEWKGTPYRHLGTLKGRGVDCTLFVAMSLKNIGLFKRIEYEYYSKDWHLHGQHDKVLMSYLDNAKNLRDGLRMDVMEELALPPYRGDIELLSLFKYGVIHHCGIYLGSDEMIHALGTRGVHITHFGAWKGHVRRTIRLKEK